MNEVLSVVYKVGFPGSSVVKKICVTTKETQEMPVQSVLGRSPGEGNGNPL